MAIFLYVIHSVLENNKSINFFIKFSFWVTYYYLLLFVLDTRHIRVNLSSVSSLLKTCYLKLLSLFLSTIEVFPIISLNSYVYLFLTLTSVATLLIYLKIIIPVTLGSIVLTTAKYSKVYVIAGLYII